MSKIFHKDLEFFDLYNVNDINNLLYDSEYIYNDCNLIIYFLNRYHDIEEILITSYQLYNISYKVLLLCTTIAFLSEVYYKYFDQKIYDYVFKGEKFNEKALNIDEYIKNIRLLKSFGKEKEVLNTNYHYNEFDFGQIYDKLYMFIFKEAYEAISLIFISYFLLSGVISFGQCIIYQRLYASFRHKFTTLFYLKSDYEECAYNDIHKFYQFYDYPVKVVSNKNKPSSINGTVKFVNVSFEYPFTKDSIILNALSFEVPKGKLYAIVGHSGNGKSTIAKLLMRFYDPNKGDIYLDNYNIKDLDVKWYRKQIGYVEQEPPLLSGSIEENITYGTDDYTEEEFKEVCELSGVDKFATNLEKFPDGYKTLVGERGVKVSGGQKQRIAIGRALMRKCKILILDEATSALDAETENEVRYNINIIRKKRGLTVIVIAHRLSTIKNADCILFMKKGKISERGTHDELINKNGDYKVLINKQLVLDS